MQMISSNFLKVGISSKKIVLVFDWAWYLFGTQYNWLIIGHVHYIYLVHLYRECIKSTVV